MDEPHIDSALMARVKAIRNDLLAIGCTTDEVKAYIVAFIQGEAIRNAPAVEPERPRPKRVK